MRKGFFIFFAFFLSLSAFSNDEIRSFRTLQASRIYEAPQIDGILNEEGWSGMSDTGNFYEFEPDNGSKSEFKTTVKVIYSDAAIYVAARMYDPNSSKILTELGLRDDDGRNADLFGFSIDTYKNGQNAFNFMVTAAGVQVDYVISNGGRRDYNWDAVWESAVVIDEKGWTVEMEIPFFSIRFPKQKRQEWGLNFYRRVQRLREESFWNYVDNSIQGLVNQYGVLEGIENVEPPLRLSFLPYVTAIYDHRGTTGNGKMSLTGGMDIKYGINESFTLDMSLIPDFSQVRSDDQILNLSPFEVRFAENRPFFTENIDIFSRNGLFYTRRVGQSRGKSFFRNSGEDVISTPGNAPLINALKLSGRNPNGTGIGIFNGITERTYAEVEIDDVEGEFTVDPVSGDRIYTNRKIVDRLYDPLTNYNVFVVDQNLKNNSTIGFINTNVTRSDGAADANVSGADFRINDKTNTYRVSGDAAVNVIYGDGNPDIGHTYSLRLNKISGTWQYGIGRSVESDNYNINDLGFLRAPNDYNHFGNLSHNIFRPFSIFNRMSHFVNVNLNQLYDPREFRELTVRSGGNYQFANFWSFGYRYTIRPKGERDFFEARNGDVFEQPWSQDFNVSISSDGRQPLFVRAWHGRWTRPAWEQHDMWLGIFSRYRVNNNLSVTYSLNKSNSMEDIGYVGVSNEVKERNDVPEDMPVFGQRDIFNTENNFGLNYTFTNKMGLNLRLRHFWSKVQYSEFYELKKSGDIESIAYDGRTKGSEQAQHDINFNAFNIDVNFSWQVAPGSFFTITWKNASLNSSRDTSLNFVENFNNVVNEPHDNSLSFRLTYFLDYVTLKNTI